MKRYPPTYLINNRYEVGSKPLEGGMGIVYLCYDHLENRPVALKTFKPEFLSDYEVRDRFLQEGATWMKLGNHPHIVRCHQAIKSDNGLEVFLVLEQIAKEGNRPDASLRSWLAPRKSLRTEQALLIALQIVRAMKYAVQIIPGLVHRDLKPENVLVGADKFPGWNVNRVRVTDFGLARVVNPNNKSYPGFQPEEKQDPTVLQDSKATPFTCGVGTAAYMSPEQWLGDKLDYSSDIYSFGLILYEMLIGERAAIGNNLTDLMRVHTTGGLESLAEEVHSSVRPLIKACLNVSPQRRFNDWAKIEDFIEWTYNQLNGFSRLITGLDMPLLEFKGREQDCAERVALGWSQYAIGISYNDLGMFDKAKYFLEKSIETGVSEKEGSLVISGLSGLGNAYNDLGKMQQAIEYYQQGLTICRKIGDLQREGTILGCLGVSYLNLGRIRQAIEYFEQTLKINRMTNDRVAEALFLANLGLAYLHL